jgi:hypothetical protein
MDRVADDPAVGEFLYCVEMGERRGDALTDVILGFLPNLQPEIQTMLDEMAGWRSRLHLFGREPVDFHVTDVAEDDFTLVIEDHDAQRELVDGFLEHPGLVGRHGWQGNPA